MNWSDFSGKKVALLGAGKENLSLIPWLKKAKADITLCEQSESDIPQAVRREINLQTGDEHLRGLENFDYLFRSPGLPIQRVDEALAGKECQPIRTSAMDLFFALGLGKTVGVTGTKGKGTTATLIGSILAAAGKKVIVAGNIGAVIFDQLEEITPETFVVLELSSFQLEDIRHSPQIAVMLPVTAEHLEPLSSRSPNFHSSVEAYRAAKANITAFQDSTDLLVYAADSPFVQKVANESSARRLGVGSGEADLVLQADGRVESGDEVLIDLAATGLRGQHIFLDAALAVAVARELGLSADKIHEGLATFKPLPHRLQKVAEIKGVTYVDDSYATAPDATIAALTAFTEPIIWIGGGSKKGAEFEQLAQSLKQSSVKKIILLGEEGPRLAEAIKKASSQEPVMASSIQEAVAVARASSQSGDVVLLSPACASKDMFKDAADRGDQFQQAL